MDLVIRLCKMVDIHDFITTKLPHGYQTVLGDNATQLSGGQKQRLNICRTLYFYHNKRAVVYVLDECTSNLDAHSDEQVMNQVVDYIQEEKKATCLIVTHKSMHKHLASRIDQTIQIQTRAKE
ncbi:putative multidrug export ATP-binding/permease protein [compost metagenome]